MKTNNYENNVIHISVFVSYLQKERKKFLILRVFRNSPGKAELWFMRIPEQCLLKSILPTLKSYPHLILI